MNDPLLFAAIFGGAAAALGWAVGVRARERAEAKAKAERAVRNRELASFPFGPGDVLHHPVLGEALLGDAIVLRDHTRPVAAVFRTKGATADERLVVVFPPPRADVLWLSETTASIAREPPPTLLLGDETFDRRALVPVVCPEGEEAKLAEYDLAGRAAFVLVSARDLVVGAGERVPIDTIDRMPGA